MTQAIRGFGGTLIGPDDPEYDAHREVWNAMVDRRPALIARCASPDDVAAAIRHARAEGLEIAVKCGGHSVLGHSVPEGGLMIDLSPMSDGHRRPRRPTRRRRGRRAPPLPRSRVAGTRARDHGRQRLAHRGRWPHARWRHGLARPPGGPRVRQRRALHARDRRRRARPRDGFGRAGAVLGPARGRRQLRGRDGVHVPPAPRRRACGRRRARLPGSRRPRTDAPLARPPSRRAPAGDADGGRRDRGWPARRPHRLRLGRRSRRRARVPADDAEHRPGRRRERRRDELSRAPEHRRRTTITMACGDTPTATTSPS